MSKHEIINETEEEEEYMEESNKIINIVCSILTEIINNEKNNINNFYNSKDFKFDLNDNFEIKSNPNISLQNYLSRILKYIKPQPSTIIISLILIMPFQGSFESCQSIPSTLHPVHIPQTQSCHR